MTRPLFGTRTNWPVAGSDGVAGRWLDLRVGDIAATYSNTDATVSIADAGGGYMLLTAADDGSAVADYPSRQQSVVWDLPAGVDGLGVGKWGAVFRLVLDTQPAAGTQFNATIGLTDGDPASGATILLAGGIRYNTTNPRLIATRRGGGGADVESSAITSPATIGSVLVSVDASTVALNQVGVHCLSADGATNGNAVIAQSVTSAYAAPLRVIMAWGCDSIAGSGTFSLRVRPQVLWFRLPA